MVEGNAKKRLAAHKKGSDEYKAEEKKLGKELQIAFDKVAKMKSPDGVKYGEMFKAHKFPKPDGAKSVAEDKEKEKEKPDESKDK